MQLRIIEVRGRMISRVLSGRWLKAHRRTAGAAGPETWGTSDGIGTLALKSGLPTMFGSREDLAVGCLMAYGAGGLISSDEPLPTWTDPQGRKAV